MRSTFVSLLSLAVLPLVAAHSNRNSRHTDAAKRGSKSLSKRSFSGQFTYFDDGMCVPSFYDKFNRAKPFG